MEALVAAALAAAAKAVSSLSAETAQEISLKGDVEKLLGLIIKYHAMWETRPDDRETLDLLARLLALFENALSVGHGMLATRIAIILIDGGADLSWSSAIRTLEYEGHTKAQAAQDRNVFKNRLRKMTTTVKAMTQKRDFFAGVKGRIKAYESDPASLCTKLDEILAGVERDFAEAPEAGGGAGGPPAPAPPAPAPHGAGGASAGAGGSGGPAE